MPASSLHFAGSIDTMDSSSELQFIKSINILSAGHTLRQPQLDRGNTARSPSRVAIPTVNTMNTIGFDDDDDDDLFTFFVNYSELTFDGGVKSYILQ